MSFFFDSRDRAQKALVEGVSTRTFWGDRILLSLVDLQPAAAIPEHSHPQEQAGMVIQGELTIRIQDEVRVCKPGDVYIVPGDCTHSVTVSAQGAQVLEAFSPVREDYKY